MDKLIRKIEKDVSKGHKAKAEKELKHLEKEDKKRDKEMAATRKKKYR